MAKRRRGPRKIRTYDAAGNELGGMGDFYFQRAPVSAPIYGATSAVWTPDPNDPNFLFAQVPAGTPTTPDVTGVHLAYPDPSTDTWIKPTDAAYAAGNVQAAATAAADAGAQIADAASGAVHVAAMIASDIVPLMIVLAALWFFVHSERA
jgi:hypothetical protein